jgi:hypothetical protein
MTATTSTTTTTTTTTTNNNNNNNNNNVTYRPTARQRPQHTRDQQYREALSSVLRGPYLDYVREAV